MADGVPHSTDSDATALVDADGHVNEPTEAIADRLPAELRWASPRGWIDDQGRPRQIVGGEMMPPIPMPETGWENPSGGHDPQQRLADMDGQGIARSVLFPTLGPRPVLLRGRQRRSLSIP